MSSLNVPPRKVFVIVGLGNVGAAYEQTRHNIGFRAVRLLADRLKLKFRDEAHVCGQMAQGQYGEDKLVLLLPMTYMNSSGEAVRRCTSYFKPALEDLMIVCDEIALQVGTIRIRGSGSSGGHNGLKSVEDHLGSQNYPRLRIGVGDREEGELADHVLSKFLPAEEKKLPAVLEKTVDALEVWMKQGIQAAMNVANVNVKENNEETKKSNL